MRLRLNFPLLLLLCALFTACTSAQIHHRQLASLDKGMSTTQAPAILGQQPVAILQTSVDGETYTFHKYFLNNGVGSDLYLLAYQGDKLKYWGYIDEFRRHPDARLNRALENVLPSLHAPSR